MNGAWLFLAAYAASGLAGLIYEVAWVRTLTLYMGHTTAATSTVAQRMDTRRLGANKPGMNKPPEGQRGPKRDTHERELPDIERRNHAATIAAHAETTQTSA